MQILDGKVAAADLRSKLAEATEGALTKPHLTAVLVGDDAPSLAYVGGKVKACLEIGFSSQIIHLPHSVGQQELLDVITGLNSNEKVDGFIVQLPLPAHIDSALIIESVASDKDVDGFHPLNLGKMMKNLPSFIPATPQGVMILLDYYGIDTSGKHCVVVGRSHIVGAPMSVLLSRGGAKGNATVTICHSKTKNLSEITRQADILIVAIGKAEFLKAESGKQGAVVIDVGISRVDDENRPSGYRLSGDVDFADVAKVAGAITPVPGGVGPMTIASLLYNTYQAWCWKNEIRPAF